MKDRIVLITKDATCKGYLSVYGNKYIKMPNLEVLAAKGTVFNRFYTAAPSTAMSFIAFSTQKYPYQTKHKTYVKVIEQEKNTIFDKLYSMGYDCHIIWEEKWVAMAKDYSQCYGEHSLFHLIHINQVVGAHNKDGVKIKCDDELANKTIETIENEIERVCSSTAGKLFLWIHLPHVLLGRNCYGSDEDMFDRVIGVLREKFGDDAIYVSADHGNMNGYKGKVCYGFDVYQTSINIPLITPRINGLSTCDTPISNVHIFDILQGQIPEDEFIYADSAYYAQPHRKLAIIHNNYKYIYNKATQTEEFYDVDFDPYEHCNMISRTIMDMDRHVMTPLDQVYYYPFWNKVDEEIEILRNEFKRIWKTEGAVKRRISSIKKVLRKYPKLYSFLVKVYKSV